MGAIRSVGTSLALGACVLLSACSPILYLVQRARAHDPPRTLPLDATVTGSTEHPDGDRYPSCAGAREGDGDSDNGWLFVPDESGTYEFRAQARHDAVLAVYPSRSEEELACNDDDGPSTDPTVRVTLTASRRYVVVVDGFRGDRGEYALRAARVIANASSTSPAPARTPSASPASPASSAAPGPALRASTSPPPP